MMARLSIFTFLSALMIVQSCGSFLYDSKNEIVIELSNADKTKKVVLFVKQAGATVADSYQVSVIGSSDRIQNEDTGNLFIADNHDGGINYDTSRVKVQWLSNDSLKITFDRRLRVFKTQNKLDDVSVYYNSVTISR